MSGTEWRSLLGFGALVLTVGFFDSKAALWLVGLLGVVTFMKHPDLVGNVFGAASSASGGNGTTGGITPWGGH